MEFGDMEHKIVLVDDTLAFCTVCKGGEGSLTTECCGRKITPDEEEHIYDIGDLDFVNGKWVKK